MAEYVSSLTDIAPVRDYLNRVGATARGLRSDGSCGQVLA
jgi:hypothetical protein